MKYFQRIKQWNWIFFCSAGSLVFALCNRNGFLRLVGIRCAFCRSRLPSKVENRIKKIYLCAPLHWHWQNKLKRRQMIGLFVFSSLFIRHAKSTHTIQLHSVIFYLLAAYLWLYHLVELTFSTYYVKIKYRQISNENKSVRSTNEQKKQSIISTWKNEPIDHKAGENQSIESVYVCVHFFPTSALQITEIVVYASE